jgi:hypothetical protein
LIALSSKPVGQAALSVTSTPTMVPAGAHIAGPVQAESAQSICPLQSSSTPFQQSSAPVAWHVAAS